MHMSDSGKDTCMNTFSDIRYGYVIGLCRCLIVRVNVGLVMSCAGIF